MKSRLSFIVLAIMLCALLLAAQGRSNRKSAAPAPTSKENVCLGCHDFDKLIQDTGKFTAPSGEKTSPHRYVPHESKKAEDAPECTNCHKAHPTDPLPAHGSIDVSKVTVQWCYDSCHHEKNLKTCKDCHQQ